MITKKEKKLIAAGPAIMAMIYGVTSPTVEIYFMKLVSPEILAVSNILMIGLAAIIQSSIPNSTIKEIYRRNFTMIVSINVVLYCTISFLSTEYVVVRFLGFAVLSSISNNLWMVIMKDAVNRKINGIELTNWTSLSKSIELYGSLIGCCLALVVSKYLDINVAIFMQCLANILLGITDLKAFKSLIR